MVGALDDQRVRLRDVEPRLDDRRRDQAVGVAAQEAEHRLPRARSRPSGRAPRRSARPGRAPRSRSAVSCRVSMRLWRKKAWPSRATSRSIARAHQLLVVGTDVGADRAPALGRGLDHRDVAQPGEAHLQRARDRRRRQRQHVDLQLQLAQQLLLAHAEALLLVDDHEPELLRAHVAREQPVGADQDVDLARGEAGERLRAPRPACAAARPSRPRTGTRPGARGTSPGAAARGSWSAPASSPACRSAAALCAARSATSVLP